MIGHLTTYSIEQDTLSDTQEIFLNIKVGVFLYLRSSGGIPTSWLGSRLLEPGICLMAAECSLHRTKISIFPVSSIAVIRLFELRFLQRIDRTTFSTISS